MISHKNPNKPVTLSAQLAEALMATPHAYIPRDNMQMPMPRNSPRTMPQVKPMQGQAAQIAGMYAAGALSPKPANPWQQALSAARPQTKPAVKPMQKPAEGGYLKKVWRR